MSTKQINIRCDSSGAFSGDYHTPGEILAVGLVIGDLSTPDVTLTDKLTGEAIFAKAGIAGTDSWRPKTLIQDGVGADIATTYGPPVVYRDLHVVVAGGGSLTSGTLYVIYR